MIEKNYSQQVRLGQSLEHLLDEQVDLISLLAALASLVEVVQHLASIASLGRGQLHGPQEVGHGFELGANGVYLVDDILDAVDTLVTYDENTRFIRVWIIDTPYIAYIHSKSQHTV